MLLIATLAFGQTARFTQTSLDNGLVYTIYFSDIDSVAGLSYTSNWFDASLFALGTPYVTYEGWADANDTVNVIIQGKWGFNTIDSSLAINTDTVDAVLNKGTTQSGLTQTAYAPYWRLYLTNQETSNYVTRDNKKLYIAIHVRFTTPPFYKNFGNLR